ncbi:condensation domain-containing protein, partial [Gordonibacter urolithinfaciens]
MSEVCVELVGKLVEEMLGLSKEELSPSDNLISLGLGSLDIMRIAGLLTKNGCNVTFSELVSNPCMASWVNFARERSARSSSNGSPLLGSANYSKGDPFPITSVQHAYMVGRRDGQELGGTACHAYMEFECGSLDAAKLERAVELLILRHPMLRARFSDDGTARIEDKVTWKGLTTYRVEGAGNPDSRIEGIRQELSHLRFDIEQDDLIDVRLTVVSPKRTIMHINVDLLAADALSIQVLLEDLAHLYDGTDLAPIEIDFMEYARRTGIGEDARNEDREYWLNRIDNMPGGPSLPLKAPMESIKRSQFTRMEYLIDSKSWKNFTEKGRQIGVTQSMGIAAVYAKALSRWSEDKKFLLNLPLFNRKPIHPDVDKIVSDFTSLILLEADCANAISLLELASQMQGRFQQDVAHSSFGAVEVLRELSHRCPNDPKKAPVVFASNIGTQFISNKVEDVFGPLSKMLAETPQVLLDHQIYDHKNGLLLAWDYVSELLDDKIAKQMFEAYCTAVRFYCENDWSEPFPDLLPPSQRAARAEANSEGADLGGGTLHGRFFARAQ